MTMIAERIHHVSHPKTKDWARSPKFPEYRWCNLPAIEHGSKVQVKPHLAHNLCRRVIKRSCDIVTQTSVWSREASKVNSHIMDQDHENLKICQFFSRYTTLSNMRHMIHKTSIKTIYHIYFTELILISGISTSPRRGGFFPMTPRKSKRTKR